jgi:hypothetical protein
MVVVVVVVVVVVSAALGSTEELEQPAMADAAHISITKPDLAATITSVEHRNGPVGRSPD